MNFRKSDRDGSPITTIRNHTVSSGKFLVRKGVEREVDVESEKKEDLYGDLLDQRKEIYVDQESLKSSKCILLGKRTVRDRSCRPIENGS